jgi:hypothetical protein
MSNFTKDFDSANYLDRRAIKRLTSDKGSYRRLYSALEAEHMSARSDIFSQMRMSIPNGIDPSQMPEYMATAKHTYEVKAEVPNTKARYCHDDYAKPVDGERIAVTTVELHERLEEAGISLEPYGEGLEVRPGDRVRICLPHHILQDRIGLVIEQRRGCEYLVLSGLKRIWCTANELRRL